MTRAHLPLDLPRLRRREALGLFAGAGVLSFLGCGGSSGDSACPTIPEETGGPYPGDGSNGPNVLSLDGVVRSDIRSSIGALSGTAAGVPLDIQLTLVGSASACTAMSGLAVYLWHCDKDGNYSMYTAPSQNYLRGIQAADGSGVLTFKTIFPGCYSGRWPHVHFEIYPTLAAAAGGSALLTTSQLALPEEICRSVYATAGYEASLGNLDGTSLSSDMVFSDGVDDQLPTISGDLTNGIVAKLTVGVDG